MRKYAHYLAYLLLAALSMGYGWGWRGDYGHELGAMQYPLNRRILLVPHDAVCHGCHLDCRRHTPAAPTGRRQVRLPIRRESVAQATFAGDSIGDV